VELTVIENSRRRKPTVRFTAAPNRQLPLAAIDREKSNAIMAAMSEIEQTTDSGVSRSPSPGVDLPAGNVRLPRRYFTPKPARDGQSWTIRPRNRPRPFQFSLRSIFIVTTLLAVVCSGLFAGNWVSLIAVILLSGLIPSALIVCMIYGRGYLRTFCIGAMVPAGDLILIFVYGTVTLTPSLADPAAFVSGAMDPQETRLYVGIATGIVLGLILLFGLFAILVRWLVERAHRLRHEG
jgi:hypothetical protein